LILKQEIQRLFCCRERTLDLELSLENVTRSRMLWTGSTSRKLGLIEPAGTIEVVLECVPQDTSLQVISGVRLTDTSLQRTYSFDDLCHVYVKSEPDEDGGNDLILVSQAG
jgi:hypothetical protein